MACFLDTQLLQLITFPEPKEVKIVDDMQARMAAHQARAWMDGLCQAAGITKHHRQQLVSEFPMEFKNQNIPPEDLFWLAATVGAIESLMPLHVPSKRVDPRTWKGTIKKEVKTEQIKAMLNQNSHERAVVDMHCKRIEAMGYKGKELVNMQGHAIDAAGLGLWHLGRVKVLH